MCPIIPQMGSRPHHANKKADNKSHLLFYGAGSGTKSEPTAYVNNSIPNKKLLQFYKENLEILFNTPENIMLLNMVKNKVA